MITVETKIHASLSTVWACFTKPEHIKKWYFASSDWHVPAVENDLNFLGKFKIVMAAKDGSAGFDFEGVYTNISYHELLEYKLADGRRVKISFVKNENGVTVVESFDPETENPHDLQQAGWQAILNNFKMYVELQ